MKRQLCLLAFLIVGFFNMNGQQLINSKLELAPLTEFNKISFFNFNNNEVTYQINVASGTIEKFNYNFSFRLEDDVTSKATYVLLNDIAFFDFRFAYILGAIQIGCFIENLLGFNNNEFAIEPNLERLFGIADSIYFTHEANFLIGTSITYNF